MDSYRSWGAGQDITPDQWVHSIDPDYWFTEPISAMRLKRGLDRGDTVEDTTRVRARIGLIRPGDSMRAIQAARSAFESWSCRPRAERFAIAMEMNRMLAEREAEFVDALVGDGHPRELARWEASGVLLGTGPRMYEAVESLMGSSWTDDGMRNGYVRQPDGVVGLALPKNAAGSNAAMALPMLAGGNAVIMKAPRSGALAAAWLFHEVILPVLHRTGVEDPVCQLVCGAPAPILRDWVSSDQVNDVFFIGGSKRGRKLEQECVQTGTKSVLELSGNDALVVWKDADVEAAALAAAECFLGSSQICIVPKLAVVHQEVSEDFLTHLEAASARYRPGLVSGEGSLLSPVMDAPAMVEALEAVAAQGGKLIFGGERLNEREEPDDYGVFFRPAACVFSDVDVALQSSLVVDESFFPILPVVVVNARTDEEVMDRIKELLQRTQYRLRLSAWGRSREFAAWVRDLRLGYGLTKMNASHTEFVAGLPTQGGRGLSGDVGAEANYPLIRTTYIEAFSVPEALMASAV